MHIFPAGNIRKKNKGFTLVELVIVISIFSILLGILVPNLNSILGFRAKRAANSITAALEKTKTEAMDRLVGEMKLSHESDGYYITYYLDHGKNGAESLEDSSEKIAPSNVKITYATGEETGGATSADLELGVGESLVITYNRETGAFRPLQKGENGAEAVLTKSSIYNTDGSINDKYGTADFWNDSDKYLWKITIVHGSSTRVIALTPQTGTYTLTVS